MSIKYFLYARKSIEDEGRQIMSIEAQLTELVEFAQRENINIAEQFVENKSAKKPGRSVFKKMIKKIERSHEEIGILAWHPDRLARNSIDGGYIIYLIDIGKVTALRFPTFWFEPTPQGLFMLQLAFGQSKYYSDNLAENVKRGMRQKLRRGEWLSRAPYGYINNFRTRTIEPDPEKASLIIKAFDEFARDMHTLHALSEEIGKWGLLSRQGKILSRCHIRYLLMNPAYVGLIRYKGELFPGTFPALVPQAIFDTVQTILEKRRKKMKLNLP